MPVIDPNLCATCLHARSDHLEGTASCTTEGCTCEAFLTELPPVARPARTRKATSARKKR